MNLPGASSDKQDEPSFGFCDLRRAPIALAVALSVLVGGSAFAAGCQEPKTGTKAIPMLSPPLSEVVIGTGRLQFYSAPSLSCAMPGVLVIPNDELIAYAQSDDGWTSV